MGWITVIYATPYGIGTSPDSAVYVGVAKNLLAGNGFTVSSLPGQYRLLTQYPPFYPGAISTFSLGGLAPIQAARILAGILFALNIFSVGLITYSLHPDTIWPAVIGAGVMLLAPAMLEIHLMAWSEPLFILLGLAAFTLLAKYLDHPRLPILILASILAGLALLTRYAGIAVVGTALLGILIFSRKTIFRRLLNALLFGIISTAPLISLLGYNRQVAGSATNRTLAFHPITRTNLWQGLETLGSWLGVTRQDSSWFFFVLGVSFYGFLILGVALYTVRRRQHPTQSDSQLASFPVLIWLLALFIVIYSLFLVISISFFDANTMLDNRILSPIFVSLLIISIFILAKRISHNKTTSWKWIGAGIAVLYISVCAMISMPLLRSYHVQGIGFSTLAWKRSPLIEEVRSLPAQIAIYSNAPDAVGLVAERPAARLPRVFEQSAQQFNPEFDTEMLALGESMSKGEAVIVYFDQPGRIDNPSLDEIQKYLPLQIQSQVADGWIFELARPLD